MSNQSSDERRERIARIRQLTTPDAGGISPLRRLQAHMVGNRNAKTLVERAVLEALVVVVADLLASPAVSPSPQLLEIAGLVSGYLNDDAALGAVGTVRQIANVLGPALESPAVSREPLISDANNRWNKMSLALDRDGAVSREPEATLREALGQALGALEGLKAMILGECGSTMWECFDGERADDAIEKLSALAQPSPAAHPPSGAGRRTEPSEARDKMLSALNRVCTVLGNLDNPLDVRVTIAYDLAHEALVELLDADPSSSREEPPSRADAKT